MAAREYVRHGEKVYGRNRQETEEEGLRGG